MEGFCNVDVRWPYSSVVLPLAMEPSHGGGEAVRPINEQMAAICLGESREGFWGVGEEGFEVPLRSRKR